MCNILIAEFDLLKIDHTSLYIITVHYMFRHYFKVYYCTALGIDIYCIGLNISHFYYILLHTLLHF